MKIHLLTGFLGSGKTTAIQSAAQILINSKKRVGVITNDQGTRLVDGDLFKALKLPERQVVNGCFCCNYKDLDTSIQSLIQKEDTEIVFAESVGSCTDIVATVLKPLLQFRPEAATTVSTFADIRLLKMILSGKTTFDDSVSYIYLKQLEEAGIIIITKIDLVSGQDLQTVKTLMQEKYQNKIILYQNSLEKDGTKGWLAVLDGYQMASSLESLSIDYELYAEGEANMAWFDQDIEIFSSDNNALMQAQDLINRIFRSVVDKEYGIGHMKFLVNGQQKISFTSPSDKPANLESDGASKADVLVNIRIQESPETVSELVKMAIKETETETGCRIIANHPAAFKPEYPTPTHRM